MSSPGTETYPIRAVARITGLSVDTLRAWERRYEAVAPRRGRRGRAYSKGDVARLRQLALLVERGHAIGTIVHLRAAAITRLLEGGDTLRGARSKAPVADLAPLLRGLHRYDLAVIEETLARHAAVLPPRELVFAVILPLLRALGERWKAGTVSPAQEHLVSGIVRSVLGGLLRTLGRTAASPKIVFATPAGERHELGLLCAAVLSAAAGYGVVYLGADLPPAEIADAVNRTGASIAVIGATTAAPVRRDEARHLLKALRTIDVWVGGPRAASLVGVLRHARHVERLDDLVPMLRRYAR